MLSIKITKLLPDKIWFIQFKSREKETSLSEKHLVSKKQLNSTENSSEKSKFES